MADYHVVVAEDPEGRLYTPASMRMRRGPSTWTQDEYTMFAVQQRIGLGKKPRRVTIRVSPNDLAILDPSDDDKVISTHPFTAIRTYQADTARHSFAWQEVSGSDDVVHEVYLPDPKRLHVFVTDTVRALARKIQMEKQARKARKVAEQHQKEREEALAAAHPPPLEPPPPPSSTATRKRTISSSKHASAATEAMLEGLIRNASGDINPSLSPMATHSGLRERRNSLADLLARRPSKPDLMGSSVMQSPPADAPILPSDVLEARVAAGEPVPRSPRPRLAGSPRGTTATGSPLMRALSVTKLEAKLQRRPSLEEMSERGLIRHESEDEVRQFNRERRSSISDHLRRRPSVDQLVEASILDDDDAFFAALRS
ncbi:uncharacterized protein AMSG_04269 [Thecamonas trahens ATCC 50062]|uniref:Uncharacterized protein n=1 Tax=Thecamonas trahens ATCC 50062 TaxID=461836 RepID=A0A0L0D7H7_THETB|nr:hypothetical protein AMSG_04269 [Thecamonas trahens ATCC 50062]KNC48036.1 hypothetical protein AMSG_04269 [Thecamonas trahens ATCC 50062]|eukprot:XP_013759051.1 hypothetical protein AMSG_04269 [Thecamonas trahens ATCC 50062]